MGEAMLIPSEIGRLNGVVLLRTKRTTHLGPWLLPDGQPPGVTRDELKKVFHKSFDWVELSNT